MFLHNVYEKNQSLMEACFQLHQEGKILPDSYVIDMDTLKENARKMLVEAKKQGIDLYFMLKQLGRNPYIAKELVALGYTGAVVVDFKEAEVMMRHHIPIANVGHLVQMPKAMIQRLVDYDCTYMSVFSLEKIKDIDACAEKSGKVQRLLLKVVGKTDHIYSGQTAGFRLEELPRQIQEIKKLKHVRIAGVTSFPCFLYDEKSDTLAATENLATLFRAKQLLEDAGIVIENINAPSATCIASLKIMGQYGIHSAEPGHGLTGTTPYHAHKECVEQPCAIYVSEVSHNFDGYGYCYGGGHYRRSHMKHALVGTSLSQADWMQVAPPDLDSIDYYFQLSKSATINDTVLMAFRFQIFVTRSNVVLLEGLHTGKPYRLRMYQSQGDERS